MPEHTQPAISEFMIIMKMWDGEFEWGLFPVLSFFFSLVSDNYFYQTQSSIESNTLNREEHIWLREKPKYNEKPLLSNTFKPTCKVRMWPPYEKDNGKPLLSNTFKPKIKYIKQRDGTYMILRAKSK